MNITYGSFAAVNCIFNLTPADSEIGIFTYASAGANFPDRSTVSTNSATGVKVGFFS